MTTELVADMLEQTFKDVDIVNDSRHNDRRKVTFWFTDSGQESKHRETPSSSAEGNQSNSDSRSDEDDHD